MAIAGGGEAALARRRKRQLPSHAHGGALVFGPAASVLASAVVLISNGTSSGTAAQTKSARGGICRFPDYEHETGQAAREGLG